MAIRNPIEWSAWQIVFGTRALGHGGRAVHQADEDPRALLAAIRKIRVRDVRDALAKGLKDFETYRTDVIFLSLIYPIVGLVLWRVAFRYDMLPLLFPLASGFALIGPVAAIGLYEMSRQHEEGRVPSWSQAFNVLRAPSIGAILLLGLVLAVVFALWLLAAELIYNLTLGPLPPVSLSAFARDVFTTGPGWAMIGVGVGVGFLFAVLSLAISVVSFPLLLDRKVGVATAVNTSIRAVIANPGPMAAWGAVVVAGLVLGSIPLFIGLAVVMPVLGHATWHLYRKVLPR
jgi:uncharacterized membrane protein